MADVTFKQDPRLAPEMFVLQEDTLSVTGGVPPNRSIPLTIVSPDYERIDRRFHRGYLVPLFFCGLFGFLAWWLFQGDPSRVRSIVAGVVAFMAFTFPFLMKFAPVEGARFLSRDGDPLFEIYRPSKSAYTYDDFIVALVQRINERGHRGRKSPTRCGGEPKSGTVAPRANVRGAPVPPVAHL